MNYVNLPSGYKVEEMGYLRRLVRSDGAVIAAINEYKPPNFRSEDFLMKMYESRDWKALEAFYGSYWREVRTRKGGKRNG